MTDETNNPNDPYVTVSVLEKTIDAAIHRQTEDICEVIVDLSTHIDKRFNKVEADIVEIKQNLVRIDDTLADMALQNMQRDTKIQRHHRWHRETAKHLGIELK